ncbi:MAG: hypothetical protein ACOYUK_03840 [Patescibacteria group bacterium]
MCLLCGDPDCPNTGAEIETLLAALTGMPASVTGVMTDSTVISVDKDGTLRRYRDGYDTKYIPLTDISGLPDSVATAFDKFHRLWRSIRDTTDMADYLREEAPQLKRAARKRKVMLRFSISDILPPSHAEFYGDHRLRLQKGAGEEVIHVIVPGKDNAGCALDFTQAEPLLREQDEIDFMLQQAEGMEAYATDLQRRADTQPDLLKVMGDEVHAEFHASVLPVLQKDGDLISTEFGFKPDGTVIIIADYHIQEEGAELPEAERNLIGAMINLDIARGAKPSIFSRIKQILGFDDKQKIAESVGSTEGASA